MNPLEPAPPAVVAHGPRTPPRDPFLIKLATRLLVKAEASEGERAVRLKLDRSVAPELADAVDAEALRGLELRVHELCDTGWVTLVLSKARDFDGWLDRKPLLELRDFDALAQWAGHQHKSHRWNQLLLAGLRRHWDQAAQPHHIELLQYLARSPLQALAEVATEDAVSSLLALQALCGSGVAMPLREASARVFHGRSKVLDSREELLRLLGATSGQFWEAPIQLLVDIPPAFDEALFIENLVTFETLADRRQPAWARSVLVYAAGFKGSAKRLRSPQGCRLYLRAGQVPDPAVAPSALQGLQAVGAWLWGDAPLAVRFFGDLDHAGMQILSSLRSVFTDAQAWRPGYAELADRLCAGGGHTPDMAAKERQIDPGTTGCDFADHQLLPLLRQHGRYVDQEIFGLGRAVEHGSGVSASRRPADSNPDGQTGVR